jgi:hypothetical protein
MVANLEGVGVRNPTDLPGRYRFVFPARHLATLKQAGIAAISLATIMPTMRVLAVCWNALIPSSRSSSGRRLASPPMFSLL